MVISARIVVLLFKGIYISKIYAHIDLLIILSLNIVLFVVPVYIFLRCINNSTIIKKGILLPKNSIAHSLLTHVLRSEFLQQ